MLVIYNSYYTPIEVWFRRMLGSFMYYGPDWYCGDGFVKDAASMYWAT